jgi:hypothetical protein
VGGPRGAAGEPLTATHDARALTATPRPAPPLRGSRATADVVRGVHHFVTRLRERLLVSPAPSLLRAQTRHDEARAVEKLTHITPDRVGSVPTGALKKTPTPATRPTASHRSLPEVRIDPEGSTGTGLRESGGSLLDGLDLRPRPEAACVRGRAGANLCGRRRRLGRRRRVHGEEPTEARVGLSRESSRSHPSRAARRVVRAQTPRRYILSESMHGGWPDCPHTRVHRAGRLTNADMVTWGSPSASMRTRLCGK